MRSVKRKILAFFAFKQFYFSVLKKKKKIRYANSIVCIKAAKCTITVNVLLLYCFLILLSFLSYYGHD